MKATALLTEDHQQIRRALAVLERVSARANQGTLDVRAAHDLLNFLQVFADRHHQGKEEGVFFPALLQDRCQKNHRPLCALIFEHNRERSLAEGLEEAIDARKPKDFAYYAGRLVEILRAHIEKEEGDLFTLAASSLDAVQDESVAEEMRNYERSWQETELPLLLRRLGELEAEYVEDGHARLAVGG